MKISINLIYIPVSIIILISWPTFIASYLVETSTTGYISVAYYQVANLGFYFILLQLITVELIYYFKARNEYAGQIALNAFLSYYYKLITKLLFFLSIITFDMWPLLVFHDDDINNNYPPFFGGINPVVFFIPVVVSSILFIASFIIWIKFASKGKEISWKVVSISLRIFGILVCFAIFCLFAMFAHGIDNYGGHFF